MSKLDLKRPITPAPSSGEDEKERIRFEEPAPKKSRSEQNKEAKALKQERRQNKASSNVVDTLKQTWETVRCKEKTEQSAEEVRAFVATVRENILEIAQKHDGARMVETALKVCPDPKSRADLVGSMRGRFVELSKSKYSKFIVMTLLKHYPAYKNALVSEFEGHMEECVKHAEAASIVDTLFSDVCSRFECNMLMLEFYGKEFTLFKDTYRGMDLDGILAKDPSKAPFIRTKLRAILDKVMKSGNLHHSVTHRLIRDYISIADKNEEFLTWLEELIPHLKQILHTFDGVSATLACLALSNAKLRKRFIKSICDKESLTNDLPAIMTDEFGHVAILGLFSMVDDTVLISETVGKQLEKEFANYIKHRVAKGFFHFLFAGGKSTRAMNQKIFQALQRAEEMNTNSKKPMDIRVSQIRQPLISPYIEYAKDQIFELMKDGNQSAILSEALCLEECEPLLTGLCQQLTPQAIEPLEIRQFLKRLIRRGNTRVVDTIFGVLKPHTKTLAESESVYVLLAMAQCSQRIHDELCEDEKLKSLYDAMPKFQ